MAGQSILSQSGKIIENPFDHIKNQELEQEARVKEECHLKDHHQSDFVRIPLQRLFITISKSKGSFYFQHYEMSTAPCVATSILHTDSLYFPILRFGGFRSIRRSKR